MRQLSGLDASFLTLETDNAPMHVGGVAIVSGETPDGRLRFERVRELLAARIEILPTLREKLAEVPFGLGRPYWVEDDDFDLDVHLQKTQLPEPGGRKELRALVDFELARPLDRSRPLWEVLYVEGVDSLPDFPSGCVAILTKVHHAAIDGVSGAEILAALFDPSPENPTIEAKDPRPRPENEREHERPPGRLELLRAAGRDFEPGVLSGALAETVRGLARSGAVWAMGQLEPPPLPFTAPRSIFNHPISNERTWSGTRISLERVKGLRAEAGCTVNDAVLAICAGALRAYLLERDELPGDPLVAMVPVSVREDDEAGTAGNLVSAMLVSLATDRDDPLERLEAIRRSTRRSKAYHRAIGARTLMEYSRLVPFGIGGLAARLYTRGHLADRHKPIFNLVITNVPGPRVPLWVAGARLLAHYGMAPIFDGMGLILPVFSYDGALALSAASCPEMMPDAPRLVERMESSLAELEEALGIDESTLPETTPQDRERAGIRSGD